MDKKIKLTIKQSNIPKTRIGKGYFIKPMIEKDKKKENNLKSCKKFKY